MGDLRRGLGAGRELNDHRCCLLEEDQPDLRRHLHLFSGFGFRVSGVWFMVYGLWFMV
jgi:hypothetical protein